MILSDFRRCISESNTAILVGDGAEIPESRVMVPTNHVNFSYNITLIETRDNGCCHSNVVKLQQLTSRTWPMAHAVR
jgi:hypothetical protein